MMPALLGECTHALGKHAHPSGYKIAPLTKWFPTYGSFLVLRGTLEIVIRSWLFIKSGTTSFK